MNGLALKTNEGWRVDRKGREKAIDTVNLTFPVDETEVVLQATSIDVPLVHLGLSVEEMDELALRWCKMRRIDTNRIPTWADSQCHAMVPRFPSDERLRRCTKKNGYGVSGKFCFQHRRHV